MSDFMADFFAGPAALVMMAFSGAAAGVLFHLRRRARGHVTRLVAARRHVRALRNVTAGPVALSGRWRRVEGGGILEDADGLHQVRVESRGPLPPDGEATVVGIATRPDTTAAAGAAYRDQGAAWVVTLGDDGFVLPGADALGPGEDRARSRARAAAALTLASLFVAALTAGLHFSALR